MKFHEDIFKMTIDNYYFRRVLGSGKYSQVVLMSVAPGEEIGEEVHENSDQLLIFISGRGNSIIEGETHRVSEGHLVFVPAGTRHNFINTGDEDLKLLTVYSPPQHEPGEIHRTKQEAMQGEHAY